MSDTYTGWDGNTYPWPPPDGWYLASDGRWWAPGTGPAAPEPASGTPEQAPGVLGGTGPAAETAQYQLSENGPAPLGGGDYPAWAPAEPPSSGRGAGRAFTVLAALVVVAGGAAAAYFVFDIGRASDGDDTAASETTASETTADSSDAATTDGQADPTDPAASGSTTASSDAQTTLSSDPAATDAPEETDPSTSTTIDIAAATEEFTNILDQNGLTGILDDEQIRTLGTVSCELAALSTDSGQFETLARQAVEDSPSPLDLDQLMLVTNAAVVTFCPEEAERLGLSL